MSIHDIPKTELIERASKELQKVDAIQPPSWAMFVKTSSAKERQPSRNDWWFVRAAAILRRLASSKGPMGVQKLRNVYGGRKNAGVAPEYFCKGSGNILRKILQQLDKAGLTKKIEKGTRKGRTVTPQGFSFLGKVADAYMKEKNIVLPAIPKGELKIVEAPKEKKVKVTKKKSAVAAEGMPTIPKRKRAPRKKKVAAEKPAEAPKAEPVEKKV